MSSRYKILIPFLFLAVGLTVIFYPSFRNGFETIISEEADGRLFHYYYENSYNWLKNADFTKSVLAANYFYPLPTTIGDNDHSLGTAPIYWLCRGVGFNPVVSLIAWAIVCEILNFISMYWLLRRELKLRIFPSSVGAWFFAFCAAKAIKFRHLQFIPEFYLVISVIFLLKGAASLGASEKKVYFYVIASGVFYALQFYSCAYLGWFFAFVFTIYAIIDLMAKETREWLFKWCGKILFPAAASVIVCLIMLIPVFGNHALMPERSWSHNLMYFPYPDFWINTHSIFYKYLDSIIYNNFNFHFLYLETSEQNFGVGIWTLIFSIFGLFVNKNKWLMNLGMAFGIIFILLLETVFTIVLKVCVYEITLPSLQQNRRLSHNPYLSDVNC